MNINDYFKLKDKDKSISIKGTDLQLPKGPFFNETVNDFFNNCIKGQIDTVDKTDIDQWTKLFDDYLNLDLPVYWIRKYESNTKISGSTIYENRRGCLTLVIEANKIIFAYVYFSNFEAQEIYNMIRKGVDAPSPRTLQQKMLSGDYYAHYHPLGASCLDDKVCYYENINNVKSGILNNQCWYLAHINDVNDIDYSNKYNLTNKDIDVIFFPLGTVKDWEDVVIQKKKYPFLSSILNDGNILVNDKNGKLVATLKRKVRIINFDDICNNFNKTTNLKESNSEIKKLYKNLLEAHFLRFVHPYNYFLTPSTKAEANYVYGGKTKNIGEYIEVVNFVRDYYKNIYSNFSLFEDRLMLPTHLINSFNGKCEIHISYGSFYTKTIKYPTRQPKKTSKTVKRKASKKRIIAKTSTASSHILIELFPSNESAFKSKLLTTKKASMDIYYNDGTIKKREWNIRKFNSSSNLSNNINSKIGHRKDKINIQKVIFKV